jgi:hypothetical protein
VGLFAASVPAIFSDFFPVRMHLTEGMKNVRGTRGDSCAKRIRFTGHVAFSLN